MLYYIITYLSLSTDTTDMFKGVKSLDKLTLRDAVNKGYIHIVKIFLSDKRCDINAKGTIVSDNILYCM